MRTSFSGDGPVICQTFGFEPIADMPQAVQVLTDADPLRDFLILLRSLFWWARPLRSW